MLNWLLRTLFKLRGWTIVGNKPPNVRKAIFAVYPHTKWQDFFLGLSTRATLHLSIGYLGKEELFRPPFGWIFRALGGTPVVRSHNQNQVQNVADTFNNHEDLLVAIAPEGTRKNVNKLKTGFYYMADLAKVPIIMVGFDYPLKQIIIAPSFIPTGNFKKDMLTFFIPFCKSIHGEQKDWIKNYENGNFGD